MSFNEKRFIIINDLAAGAENASTHCVFETNRMNGFVQGLTAALEILAAENDAMSAEIAAKWRKVMASRTSTCQENWRVGNIIPDKNWIV